MYEYSFLLKIAIVLIGSIASGILYRLGGKEGYNTKFRDLGVPFVCVGMLVLLGIPNILWAYLSLIPCFGMMFGMLTTYRYFLPKPTDYMWYHYALHGFMVALAMIFFAWASGLWLGFIIRTILCAGLVGAWSHFTSWDEIEEFGRGFFIGITMPLLLLGV